MPLDIKITDEDGNILTQLTQWDKNRTIGIEGLDNTYTLKLYFYNRQSEESTPVTPTFRSGHFEALVPNALLEMKYPLIIDVCDTKNSVVKTLLIKEIPVRKRARPRNE